MGTLNISVDVLAFLEQINELLRVIDSRSPLPGLVSRHHGRSIAYGFTFA